MRRQDKEIKDKTVIDHILSSSRICRLGMVDCNEAYIVPVNFAYSEGHIYVHSAPHGRKMDYSEVIRMSVLRLSWRMI